MQPAPWMRVVGRRRILIKSSRHKSQTADSTLISGRHLSLAAASTAATKNDSYRADIDGLRAIAVVMVVAYHAFPSWLKGGFIGVDIFFVISGYLISSIIITDINKSEFSFAEFYKRRIRRIFPALLLVLLVSIAFGWYVLLSDEYAQLGKHVLSGLLFISNLTLWSEAGYFDNAAESKPLLHLWSLGIEEQFYLLWPVLLWFLFVKNRLSTVAIVFMILGSFILNISIISSAPTAAFYAPFSRFWELLSGALLASINSSKSVDLGMIQRRFGNLISVAGVMLVLIAVALTDETRTFPGWWAILPVAGAVCLISAGPHAWVNITALSNPVFVWIGTISYPLYLWHWPILSYLAIVSGELPSREMKIAAVLLSVILAWLTFVLVERPFRFGSLKKNSTRTLIISAVLVSGFALAVSGGLLAPRNDGPELQKLIAAANDRNFPEGFSEERIGRSFFHVLKTGNPEITLFIGDSHIQHYGPRLREIAKVHGESMRSVYLATWGGCPPIPNVYAPHNEPDCSSMRSEAIKFAADPRVKTIVIGGCWNCYFIHQALSANVAGEGSYHYDMNGEKVRFRDDKGSSLAQDELERFLGELVQTGKQIFFLLDNPHDVRLDPKTYLEGGRISREMILKEVPSSVSSLEAESRLHATLIQRASRSGARLIDPRAEVCNLKTCSLFDSQNNHIFQDRNHFTANYVKHAASFIDQTVISSP
jgi:peptidoglycan/LPS O-acetylase OafA/YrhL